MPRSGETNDSLRKKSGLNSRIDRGGTWSACFSAEKIFLKAEDDHQLGSEGTESQSVCAPDRFLLQPAEKTNLLPWGETM